MIRLILTILHATPLAKGTDRIYYPGEIEWERYERTLKEGMLLFEDVENRYMYCTKNQGLTFAGRIIY